MLWRNVGTPMLRFSREIGGGIKLVRHEQGRQQWNAAEHYIFPLVSI